MNVAAVIARYLKAAGIGHVFGYPGDSNVELIEALRRHEIDFVLARREGTDDPDDREFIDMGIRSGFYPSAVR